MLSDVPTELPVATKAHVDNLVRELSLAASNDDVPEYLTQRSYSNRSPTISRTPRKPPKYCTAPSSTPPNATRRYRCSERCCRVRLRHIPGFDIATYYRPADEQETGGDFYDVISLPEGRFVRQRDDALGRGVAAAAAMSQIRTMIRSYNIEDPSPTAVFRKVDTYFIELDVAQLVTVMYTSSTEIPVSSRSETPGRPPRPPSARGQHSSSSPTDSSNAEAKTSMKACSVRSCRSRRRPARRDHAASSARQNR